MLQVNNLTASADGKKILNGVSLKINPGEIHCLMGPNGSGKSTLSNVIMGHPKYDVDDGEIIFDGEDITELAVDKRARRGLFLAFQYPKEIPGVSLTKFLRSAYNAMRKEKGEDPVNVIEFRKLLRGYFKEFSLDAKFLNRDLNDGFSGGEKKKVEILQMALLNPKLAVLDETDSGLDVDALKIVAEGVNSYSSKERGILLITHYQRILDYIKPDFVHVMMNGRIVESGGGDLAVKLEKEGYEWIREKHGIPEISQDDGVSPIPAVA
jgi:Fe-S cluster assembly ATP-binding protein